jgi:MFS family permease
MGLFLVGAWLTWTCLASVSGFYAIRLDELGAPAAVVGAAAALGAAVEVPIMLRFPALAARFGAERLLVAGAAIFALRAVAAALLVDPPLLVVLSGINGIGFALFTIGGVGWVSRHAPPALAATAQGIFQGVTVSFAQVAAAGAGGTIAESAGLVRLYLLSGAVGGIGTLLVAAAIRRDRRTARPDRVVAVAPPGT